MIEAYVANLAMLDMGLAGPEPIVFPTDIETAQALFKQLGVEDGQHDMVITEFHCDIPGLSKCLSQYDNLDELNYLASLLDDMSEADREKFAAAAAYGDYASSPHNLINLTQNLDCYDYYPGITTEEELGYFLIDELNELEMSEKVASYFNYEEYGRDAHLNGGTFTHAGYIESNGIDFTEHYNGRDIPAEYRLLARSEPSPPELEGGNDLPTGQSQPLAKNKDVQALLSLMEANNLSTAKDLRTVVEQVTAMENQLHAAVGELTVMRRELADAQNHPFKTSLQNTVDSMQAQVNVLRERLADLKDTITEGCRDALSAVKDKGLSALRNITEFFKVKPMLEGIRADLDLGIKENGEAIRKIVSMSNEYHKAGLHVKNMGRAMVGKEALTEAKSPGKLAVAIATPFRNERQFQMRARAHVTKAIDAVDRLQNRDRKPPIMEQVEKINKQIEEAKRDAPTRVRPRPVSHDGR